MKTQHAPTPQDASGNAQLASPYTDKRGYAQRWQGSTRWVDDLIARGLPIIKTSARRVRINIAEADEWMQQQFRTQRIGAAKT